MKPSDTELEKNKEVESFVGAMQRKEDERSRITSLIQRFKRAMPRISGHWDTSQGSIQHNDIAKEIREKGLAIYITGMDELWAGLYKPALYDANTLWSDDHESRKIAMVTEAWSKEQKLSPLFLVKYDGDLDLGLVSDGKHRLTVARAISAKEVPFMVEMNNDYWVKKAFPSAHKLNS